MQFTHDKQESIKSPAQRVLMEGGRRREQSAVFGTPDGNGAERASSDDARQEALYSFLLQRGEKWTSMEQTTDSIPLYPAYFRGSYHNSTARRVLTADIEQINNSEQFEKIIVSGNKGIKIASANDFERFLKAEFSEIFKKLRRVRRIAQKGSRDQQIDLEGQIREAFLGGE